MDEEIILLIGKIGAVIMVGFLAFSLWPELAKTNTSQKVVVAEDVRMMVNTLVSVPGDALVYYPGNTSTLMVALSSSKVDVFEKGESDVKWRSAGFVLPEEYSAEGLYDGSLRGRLCLEKIARRIIVRSCSYES